MDYLVWNIDPVAIEIGSLKIRWYGILFASAFVVCFHVMQWMYQREGKNIEDIDRLLWYVAIGTIAGARLGHCLFYDPEYYLSHPLKVLAIWEGGLASHGGNLGVLVALYFFKRKTQVSYLWIVDRVAVAAALGASFVRTGNFFNSEILGIPTYQPWAVIFSNIDSLPRHPVQLYEAICYLVVFGLLLVVYKQTADKPIRGLLFGLFTSLVFSIRFVLEYFKTEQAAYITGLSINTGQMLSIPFALVGVGFVVWALKNYRKQI